MFGLEVCIAFCSGILFWQVHHTSALEGYQVVSMPRKWHLHLPQLSTIHADFAADVIHRMCTSLPVL